jgi:hypothetical protein
MVSSVTSVRSSICEESDAVSAMARRPSTTAAWKSSASTAAVTRFRRQAAVARTARASCGSASSQPLSSANSLPYAANAAA